MKHRPGGSEYPRGAEVRVAGPEPVAREPRGRTAAPVWRGENG